MPMNEFGEIVRNIPTTKSNPSNRNNKNSNSSFLAIVVAVLFLIFIISAISETSNPEPTTIYNNVTTPSESYTPTKIDYGLFKDGHGISSSDYVIKGSNSRYLTANDTNQLTLRGINYAKNEIYARHGRKFKSKELQEFFNSRAWYNGNLNPTKESDRRIREDWNSYEKSNAELLLELENTYGPYKLDK